MIVAKSSRDGLLTGATLLEARASTEGCRMKLITGNANRTLSEAIAQAVDIPLTKA